MPQREDLPGEPSTDEASQGEESSFKIHISGKVESEALLRQLLLSDPDAKSYSFNPNAEGGTEITVTGTTFERTLRHLRSRISNALETVRVTGDVGVVDRFFEE